MELSGFPEAKGEVPEMYFSQSEESMAKDFRNYWDDKFMVLWGLAGSAYHKAYPWAEYVAGTFAKRHEDVLMITVGDEPCKVLEWHNARTINQSGNWTVRQSFIMTKYADLVVGSDTGLLNAASCYDTSKIIFMSTNSIENLTKYWKNVTPLFADDCECQPCHRLIYSNSCPKGTISGVAPKCMEHIKPEVVLDAMERQYDAWKARRLEKINKLKVAAFTIADDKFTHRLANRTKNSFKHYHPDVEFLTYDVADEEKILGERRVAGSIPEPFALRPRLASKLLDDYDIVIYLDADTVVTAPLDEFMEGDYDVAGSLNISDDESNDFMNAGVCSVRSKQFCDEWTEAVYRPNAGNSNQPSFNKLAHSDRYRLKIVDKKDVYYNERSRQYWKDIEVKDFKLYANGRQIKVLHWAGGIPRMEAKLSSADFNDEVRKFLDNITMTTDFTANKGEEVSKWG
jgi:hypothetical protein